MLNEIAEYVVVDRLQDLFVEDPEYKELSAEESRVEAECFKKLPEELRDIVDQLMSCQNACSARLIDLAYRQGMLDCAELLNELNITGDK